MPESLSKALLSRNAPIVVLELSSLLSRGSGAAVAAMWVGYLVLELILVSGPTSSGCLQIRGSCPLENLKHIWRDFWFSL